MGVTSDTKKKKKKQKKKKKKNKKKHTQKKRVTYFYMGNPYMKFQNISIHSSKLMLCTWKQQMAKNCKGP